MSSPLQTFSQLGATFLFLLLEMIAVVLIVVYNEPQRKIYDTTIDYYGNIFSEKKQNTRDYFRLREINEGLRAENAQLRQNALVSFYDNNAVIDSLQNDSLHQRYTYLAAQVINKTAYTGNITYVLNRGTVHNVVPNVGVINERGVVGIVTRVSQFHCRVMSVTHRSSRLTAGLRGKNAFGTLRWNGGDTRIATLYSIPEYAAVGIGDTIETTGYSNIFPTGVPIGTVSDIGTNPGDNSYELAITLFNNYFDVDNTYIVSDLMKEDIEQLETE